MTSSRSKSKHSLTRRKRSNSTSTSPALKFSRSTNISSPKRRHRRHKPKKHSDHDPIHISQTEREISPPTTLVSSFLSMFKKKTSTRNIFSDSTSPIDIESFSDLELLKSLKRRLLDIVSQFIEKPVFKKLKNELSKNIWSNEYLELKKRLSTNEVRKRVQQQKIRNMKSLKEMSNMPLQSSTTGAIRTRNRGYHTPSSTLMSPIPGDPPVVYVDDGEDIREMAQFLLQTYYEEPVASLHSEISKNDEQEDDDEEDEEYYMVNIDINDDASFVDHINESESDHGQHIINESGSSDAINDILNENVRKQLTYEHSPKKNISDDKSRMKRKKNKSRKYRREIRTKFRRGVRRAMMLNAWTCVISETRQQKSSNEAVLPLSLPLFANCSTSDVSEDTTSPSDVIKCLSKRTSLPSFMISPSLSSPQFLKQHKSLSFDKQEQKQSNNCFSRTSVRSSVNVTPRPEDNDVMVSLDIIPRQASLSMTMSTMISCNLQKSLKTLGTWEFDPFTFLDIIKSEGSGKCLVLSTFHILQEMQLFKYFNFSPKKFITFLSAVENAYIDNPYHNNIHATDVVSNTAFFLMHSQFFQKHTSPLDQFATIIAACVHDLGHDGNNNAFHIQSMSELAVEYNDISVLENYHISLTFRILKRSECNWFKTFTKAEQRYLRQTMIDIVLATDMKFHNLKLEQLTNLIGVLRNELNRKSRRNTCNSSIGIVRRDSLISNVSEISSVHTSLPNTPAISVPLMTPLYGKSESVESNPRILSLRQSNQTNITGMSVNIKYDESNADSCSNYDTPPVHNSSMCSNITTNDYFMSTLAISDMSLHKCRNCVNRNVSIQSLITTTVNDSIIEDNNPRVIGITDERSFILQLMVHLCDISNCAKSLNAGKIWAKRLMTEFFKQGDRERQLGYTVSAMMDRRRSSTPQAQIGFIKFILRPMLEVFSSLVPEAIKPLEIANANLVYWQKQQIVMACERQKRAKSCSAKNMPGNLLAMQKHFHMLSKSRLMLSESNSLNAIDRARSNNTVGNALVLDLQQSVISDTTKNSNSLHVHQNMNLNTDENVRKVVHFNDVLVTSNIHSYVPTVNYTTVLNEQPADIAYNGSGSSTYSHENDAASFYRIPSWRTTSANSSHSQFIPYDLQNHMDDDDNNRLILMQNDAMSESNGAYFLKKRGFSLDSRSSEVGSKKRAHSIHVSLPTSEQQEKQQPIPFEMQLDSEQSFVCNPQIVHHDSNVSNVSNLSSNYPLMLNESNVLSILHSELSSKDTNSSVIDWKNIAGMVPLTVDPVVDSGHASCNNSRDLGMGGKLNLKKRVSKKKSDMV